MIKRDCQIFYDSDKVSDHYSVITVVTVRSVPSNSSCAMTSKALKSAMALDLEKGHYPFFVVATLGTTSTCAFDEVCKHQCPLCKRHNANITL